MIWEATPAGHIATLVRHARTRGRRERVPATLSRADLGTLPTVCPVLGVPIEYGASRSGAANPYGPSLDRIIPRLGYVPGNVRIVSVRANLLRNDGTAEELRLVAEDAERIRACRLRATGSDT